MKPKSSNVIVRYRDSVDGQFVKKTEADRRPRETEKQHIRVPTRHSPPKK
jgi:hypothetical protein